MALQILGIFFSLVLFLFLPSPILTGLETLMIIRSTIGYLVYLGYNPITWSAKKQLTISYSSTKFEYRALAASTAAELCRLR